MSCYLDTNKQNGNMFNDRKIELVKCLFKNDFKIFKDKSF